jgi:hypothetical protein
LSPVPARLSRSNTGGWAKIRQHKWANIHCHSHHPGARRGEVRLELRGDLAAFMHLTEDGGAASNNKTAVLQAGNGGSRGVMGSLVAGAGFEPAALRL